MPAGQVITPVHGPSPSGMLVGWPMQVTDQREIITFRTPISSYRPVRNVGCNIVTCMACLLTLVNAQ